MERLHRDHGSPPPLDELTEDVRSACDRFALEAGWLLQLARDRNRRKYRQWVATSTPFTLAEAERLRAIYVGNRDLPPEIAAQLPRPSMALTYAFTPTGENLEPSPTRNFSQADLLASALTSLDPSDLSVEAVDLLTGWLRDRGRPSEE